MIAQMPGTPPAVAGLLPPAILALPARDGVGAHARSCLTASGTGDQDTCAGTSVLACKRRTVTRGHVVLLIRTRNDGSRCS
jgi:hypothetical protein